MLVLSLLLISAVNEETLRTRFFLITGLICTVSVTYRLVIVIFPGSLIGMDPDEYAWAIRNVVNTGTIAGSEFSIFYEQTGIMLAFGGVSSILMDIPGREAMAVYAVVLGLLVPLSVVVIARSLWPTHPRIAVYSASIASVATATLKFSGWPIAQSLAVVFWVVFLYLFLRYLGDDWRLSALALCIALPFVFTHKLAPLIAFLATSGVLLGTISMRLRPSKPPLRTSFRPVVIFSLVVAALAYLQWNMSEYFAGVVWHLLRTVSSVGGGESGVVEVTSAEPALNGLTMILYRRGHALALAAIAGIGWLFLLTTQRRPATHLVLGCVTVITGTTALAFVAPGLSFERPLFFAEPLLAIMAGVVLSAIVGSDRLPSSKQLVRIVFLGLLVTQAFAAPAIPDSTHQPRYYLDSNEMQSKQFAGVYGPETVHTDFYLTEERADWTGTQNTKFEPIDRAYLTGSIEGEYILHRSISVRYTPHLLPQARESIWVLRWNPKATLDHEYHRVYDSGSTTHYKY